MWGNGGQKNCKFSGNGIFEGCVVDGPGRGVPLFVVTFWVLLTETYENALR